MGKFTMKMTYHKTSDYDQEYGNKFNLYLNNFGYFDNINQDIKVFRPNGRLDYHIIYVSNGNIEINGTLLKNGDYCVYSPNEPQSYVYKVKENSRYYWLHFTGNKVKDILNDKTLKSGIHESNGRINEIDTLFLSLSREAIHASGEITDYAVALLYAILQLFSSPTPKAFQFLRAKNDLEDLSINKSIAEVCSYYNMTPEHFIRSFKKAYGTTPANYRINHQLTQAKNLLLDTQLEISSISEMCGFSDPYYFSRLFKKHVGITPTHFRKTHLEKS